MAFAQERDPYLDASGFGQVELWEPLLYTCPSLVDNGDWQGYQ